jgi:eukaryotic translation initiation factor 2C
MHGADALEQLSYSICYLFGRATKAVSVCPLAYYADLVCERARCYLAQVFALSPLMSLAASVGNESVAEV